MVSPNYDGNFRIVRRRNIFKLFKSVPSCLSCVFLAFDMNKIFTYNIDAQCTLVAASYAAQRFKGERGTAMRPPYFWQTKHPCSDQSVSPRRLQSRCHGTEDQLRAASETKVMITKTCRFERISHEPQNFNRKTIFGSNAPRIPATRHNIDGRGRERMDNVPRPIYQQPHPCSPSSSTWTKTAYELSYSIDVQRSTQTQKWLSNGRFCNKLAEVHK